jgi:hypothetical protein
LRLPLITTWSQEGLKAPTWPSFWIRVRPLSHT